MSNLDPLIEETLAASIAMAVLAGLVALLYWLMTGLSPWPIVILGEMAGFGFGIAVLALTAPRLSRNALTPTISQREG
ncbi:MAG: hypothetical protein HYY04_15645 [Chloroflexi bacterium]|nr:hypothetical protein [Chloroflexota bacterium]